MDTLNRPYRPVLCRVSMVAVVLVGLQVMAAAAPVVDTIAIGSCLRQHEPQPIWDSIIDVQPDLFVFMGDNVYADTDDMEIKRMEYEQLSAQPGYQRLRSMCPILATWDDHDYGWNDAGAEYPMKSESQQIFQEFFNISRTSPLRSRPGVYDVRVYGVGGKRVQVILLDTRYFRGPLKRGQPSKACRRGVYLPNEDPEATMLGEAQWQWLGGQLRLPAEVRIIVSSIQVIPEQHCKEKWANLPRERTRLFELIGDTKAGGVIFISGDRHLAEISALAGSPAGYRLYELTSSGLNSAGAGEGEVNRYRLTPDNFRGDNFGTIRIDWRGPDPQLALQIRDVAGRVVMEQRLRLSELQP